MKPKNISHKGRFIDPLFPQAVNISGGITQIDNLERRKK